MKSFAKDLIKESLRYDQIWVLVEIRYVNDQQPTKNNRTKQKAQAQEEGLGVDFPEKETLQQRRWRRWRRCCASVLTMFFVDGIGQSKLEVHSPPAELC